MATKKKGKKGKGQLSLNIIITDERIPQLVGILCLFLAIYLFIAFTSYIFTWEVDQDRVLQFSWGLLLENDFQMANWLGRLGAIVSNMFFVLYLIAIGVTTKLTTRLMAIGAEIPQTL